MTRWVAELGSSHNGTFERAMALVEAAAACGFQDVKTQAWTVEGLYAPEALKARPELLERKRLELDWSWHKPLSNRCKELGLGYGVSVFRAEDVRRAAVEADWLKASSYSVLDFRLTCAMAQQPKPVVISTGMATEDEVAGAIAPFYKIHDLTLLHAVSAYPAEPHECCLRSIEYMRKRFGVPVGWSDHTVSPLVLARAERAFGASMVEVHFDLDDQAGYESAHSWTPKALAARSYEMTDSGYYACDGRRDFKGPSLSETEERMWRADPSDGFRPLVSIRPNLALRRQDIPG